VADKKNQADQQAGGKRRSLGIALGGAVAAGAGLFLWNRRHGAVRAEVSTADEVEAHPS
jgi:hypothetical protein